MNATRGASSPRRCSCASTHSLAGRGRPHASIAVLLAAAVWAVPGPSAGAQIEGPQIIAPDGDAGDQFGWSIDISGNTAIIGAWFDEINDQFGAFFSMSYSHGGRARGVTVRAWTPTTTEWWTWSIWWRSCSPGACAPARPRRSRRAWSRT